MGGVAAHPCLVAGLRLRAQRRARAGGRLEGGKVRCGGVGKKVRGRVWDGKGLQGEGAVRRDGERPCGGGWVLGLGWVGGCGGWGGLVQK